MKLRPIPTRLVNFLNCASASCTNYPAISGSVLFRKHDPVWRLCSTLLPKVLSHLRDVCTPQALIGVVFAVRSGSAYRTLRAALLESAAQPGMWSRCPSQIHPGKVCRKYDDLSTGCCGSLDRGRMLVDSPRPPWCLYNRTRHRIRQQNVPVPARKDSLPKKR